MVCNKVLPENFFRFESFLFAFCSQSENIQLDPELKAHCEDDVTEFCSNVSPGKSGVNSLSLTHSSSSSCYILLAARILLIIMIIIIIFSFLIYDLTHHRMFTRKV